MNEKEMKKVCNEMQELLIKKNKAYGDENIAVMGKLGIITRIKEKIERLENMIKNNVKDEETKEDSWKDIAGFGIIGVMLERNKWKNGKNKKK